MSSYLHVLAWYYRCHKRFNFSVQGLPYIFRQTTTNDTITRLWSYLSLDNFKFQGQHYIMTLDTLKKFFVVRTVQSLSTNCTIQILTSVFSKHGLPSNIRCDRGRNFVSDHFQDYCSHLGINLTFSSTYHHSSNPAERAIRTIKMLIK